MLYSNNFVEGTPPYFTDQFEQNYDFFPQNLPAKGLLFGNPELPLPHHTLSHHHPVEMCFELLSIHFWVTLRKLPPHSLHNLQHYFIWRWVLNMTNAWAVCIATELNVQAFTLCLHNCHNREVDSGTRSMSLPLLRSQNRTPSSTQFRREASSSVLPSRPCQLKMTVSRTVSLPMVFLPHRTTRLSPACLCPSLHRTSLGRLHGSL